MQATSAAFREAGFAPRVVDWRAVLDGNWSPDGAVVGKIEPPESPDDEPVLRALIARGGGDARAPIAPGELRSPSALARGWRAILGDLDAKLASVPMVVPPKAIAVAFDKLATVERLERAGLPVVRTAEFTLDDIDGVLGSRAFVKLRYGSGGHGIVVTNRGRARASFARRPLGDGRTGWAHVRGQPELESPRAALEMLAVEGAVVQPAITPLAIEGWTTDLRIVVLDGNPSAFVWRQAQGPITNLEQGGRRGDPRRCACAVTPRALSDARLHAARAVAALDATTAGVDLVFDQATDRFLVLEINPFGDFFPNLLDEAHRSLPQQLAAHLARS